MNIKLQVASVEHVEEILTLHYKYQIDSISEDDKQDGFITTAFSKEHLVNLIEKEQGLFIALQNDQIVAYAMSASWQFWLQWPMFQYMLENLHDSLFEGQSITADNSYQYGPVCVDKSIRGQGVFEKIFDFSLEKMSKKYPLMVTFINRINPRSYQAHTRKAGLTVIKEFEFNNNHYYKLACKTV